MRNRKYNKNIFCNLLYSSQGYFNKFMKVDYKSTIPLIFNKCEFDRKCKYNHSYNFGCLV